MIVWLNTAALGALALLAGPLLVHLLLRHRARRVAFPSLRFLRVSQTASMRFRSPSDAALLALRLAIVALAVAACAQPVLLTQGRIAAWNRRVARAIVVDRSPSMAGAADDARRLAEAESQSAAFARPVEAAGLRDGLDKAVASLKTMPPARREIVVISDFQIGSLHPADVDRVPHEIGLRLVQVGVRQSDKDISAFGRLTRDGAIGVEAALAEEGTRARPGTVRPQAPGLELLTDSRDAAALLELRHAVIESGTPAPSPDQQVTIAFAGAPTPAVRPIAAGWMLDTALRLHRDAELRSACEAEDAGAVPDSDAWFTLCRDRLGRPLARAAASAGRLVVHVAAAPSAFVAAAAVRGVLVARQGTTARPEDEVRWMSGDELSGLTRPPAPVSRQSQDLSLPSDARWCWLAVLVLLAIEGVVRRSRVAAAEEAHAHAA
jgi:hypothetical protein